MPDKKQFFLIVAFFLILALAATYPVVFKMNTSVYGPLYGTDNRGVIWNFWWLDYCLKHGLNHRTVTVLAYPHGIDYSAKPYFPLYDAIFAKLTDLTNKFFAYNLALLSSFVLSALFAFFAVYFLTGSIEAGMISGLIFGFSPYHFNKAWEHFSLAQIQWIPLYTLALLALLKKPGIKNAAFAALSFTLIMAFDFSYVYIMGVFTIGLAVFLLFYNWRFRIKPSLRINQPQWKIRPFETIIFLFCSAILISLINFAVLYPIVKTMFFTVKKSAATAYVYERPLVNLITHSARPLSYFLPASAHPVFGKFTKSMFGSVFYGRNAIENTLYLGIIPLLLSYAAFKYWKNKRIKKDSGQPYDDFIIGFFIFSAWLAFALSMPPYINLGIFKLYFPSYFMHKLAPMYRAYARFGVVVILCVSVLSGYGVKFLLQRLKRKNSKIVFILGLICVIIFEFINIPPFRVTEMKNWPQVYLWLKDQPGDFAVAEYPMTKGAAGETVINNDYLLYQTVHQKRLVNGAIPGTEAFEDKEKILRIADVDAQAALKKLGVKYVVFHKNLYETGEYKEAVKIAGNIPNPEKSGQMTLLKSFGDDLVYEFKK